MRPRLILFDIDGTLISVGRVFRRALGEALEAIFATRGPMDTFDFSGRTDPEIVRGLMRAAGHDDAQINSRISSVLDRYSANLVPLLVPEAVVPKPGIPRLIERLAGHPHVTLGLLTGNIERTARAKLAPLDLNGYFPFGAYGSDHEERSRLPTVAVERAYAHTRLRFGGKDIVIVGDSVHDVRCGQALGVRALGVASGSTSRARLETAGADLVLDSFADTDAAEEACLG